MGTTREPTSNWATNKDNPHNWPRYRKITTAIIVSATVALLPLSAYSLGLAFGPMISSPLSETSGRKVVYLITLPPCELFLLAAGFSRNISALTICRFFAGLFAAPGASVAAAVISDFTSPDQRVISLAGYYAMPWLGSAIGPLVGGFAVERKGWRWTSWHKARNGGYVDHLDGVQTKSVLQNLQIFITSTIIRPLHMLITEPLVGFICLYTGFQFALLYTFIVASPWVFNTVYRFSLSGQSLSFLGMVGGCIFAPFILVTLDYVFRTRKQNQISLLSSTSQSSFLPENKLLAALYGSLVLPIALFWFGWSAKPSVYWICPILARAIAFIGSFLIYVPFSFYMVDVYGAQYIASANGASSFSRYMLSAAFPLFVTQMYETLGVGWASSLLGFVALVMAPIPWVFYRFGPVFRARSSYEHGS
ncbi:hypothetical protein N7540_003623 [Penicillium herquei]|nr:hypothetical protein N7540_003623 [Penicillium herquei]